MLTKVSFDQRSTVTVFNFCATNIFFSYVRKWKLLNFELTNLLKVLFHDLFRFDSWLKLSAVNFNQSLNLCKLVRADRLARC